MISFAARPAPVRILIAGLLTGVTDGLFSSVLSVAFYHSTVVRLFQGVASVLFGAEAMKGGVGMAAVGILMHFGVAFAWSSVFFAVLRLAPALRKLLGTPYGIAIAAAVYGPLVWTMMSMVVVPIVAHRPPAPITSRWWTQFFGHIVFVGLPIAWTMSRRIVARYHM